MIMDTHTLKQKLLSNSQIGHYILANKNLQLQQDGSLDG